MSAAPDDFGRRVVIPLAERVKGPPFTDEHAARAAIIRETCDLFNLDRHIPLTPPAEPLEFPCESIVMQGDEVRVSLRTGGLELRRQFTTRTPADEPLRIVTDAEIPAGFVPASEAQLSAAEALRVLESRPRRPVQRPVMPAEPSVWPALLVGGLCLVAMLVTAVVVLR